MGTGEAVTPGERHLAGHLMVNFDVLAIFLGLRALEEEDEESIAGMRLEGRPANGFPLQHVPHHRLRGSKRLHIRRAGAQPTVMELMVGIRARTRLREDTCLRIRRKHGSLLRMGNCGKQGGVTRDGHHAHPYAEEVYILHEGECTWDTWACQARESLIAYLYPLW